MNTKNPQYKSWKKYLLEFLLLFLAVFLGFFADNLRDRSSEKKKEQGYISSLIVDVSIDKANIEKAIENNEIRKRKLDTLSMLCYNYDKKETNLREIYDYYQYVLIRPDFFTPNEVTMLQLKNAGGMSLISKKEVVRELLQYDLQEKKLSKQQDYYENYQNNTIGLALKVFTHEPYQIMRAASEKKESIDLSTLDFELIQDDELLLTQFANVTNMYSGIVNYYNILLKETEQQADSLIVKLKGEYKVD